MKKKLFERYIDNGGSCRGDLTDLIRPGNHGPTFVPEQERNFDAGHTPSPTPMRFIREEWIDGKLYKVWQQ